MAAAKCSPRTFSLTATCARPQVEPIVDCVDARQVVTDAVPLLSIDLATCTVADLSFESTFELTAGYDDYVSCAHFLSSRAAPVANLKTFSFQVHAFVGYFDCDFSASHKPLTLPTGPEHIPTHWKQTVFYLKDPLTVGEGEKISGVLRCVPNGDNHRDLDIDISVKFNGKHSQLDAKQEYRLR